MLVTDGNGVPIGFHLDSASPAEVKLAEQTLQTVRVKSSNGQDNRTVQFYSLYNGDEIEAAPVL
jgi:uncharacterized protein YfaP (DUF2135 family)